MITSVSATTDSTASAADMKKTAGLNKDDFLNLFVTQLKNQDPMNPQDSSQFIAQLAQLTQVEQSYNANSNLQALLNQGNNSMAVAAVSFIGKEVQAQGSQVSLQAGNPAQINYNLASGASQVTVSVQDAAGQTVKTLTTGAAAAGDNSVAWDGTGNDGTALPPGAYSFAVNAVDQSGNKVVTTSLIKGTVTGVDMSGATPVLSMGSVQLPLTQVTAVNGG